jgi:hypothetical protein
MHIPHLIDNLILHGILKRKSKVWRSYANILTTKSKCMVSQLCNLDFKKDKAEKTMFIFYIAQNYNYISFANAKYLDN